MLDAANAIANTVIDHDNAERTTAVVARAVQLTDWAAATISSVVGTITTAPGDTTAMPSDITCLATTNTDSTVPSSPVSVTIDAAVSCVNATALAVAEAATALTQAITDAANIDARILATTMSNGAASTAAHALAALAALAAVIKDGTVRAVDGEASSQSMASAPLASLMTRITATAPAAATPPLSTPMAPTEAPTRGTAVPADRDADVPAPAAATPVDPADAATHAATALAALADTTTDGTAYVTDDEALPQSVASIPLASLTARTAAPTPAATTPSPSTLVVPIEAPPTGTAALVHPGADDHTSSPTPTRATSPIAVRDRSQERLPRRSRGRGDARQGAGAAAHINTHARARNDDADASDNALPARQRDGATSSPPPPAPAGPIAVDWHMDAASAGHAAVTPASSVAPSPMANRSSVCGANAGVTFVAATSLLAPRSSVAAVTASRAHHRVPQHNDGNRRGLPPLHLRGRGGSVGGHGGRIPASSVASSPMANQSSVHDADAGATSVTATPLLSPPSLAAAPVADRAHHPVPQRNALPSPQHGEQNGNGLVSSHTASL